MTASAIKISDITFAAEPWERVFADAQPLLEKHWEEIAKHKDLFWLNVDIEMYKKAEQTRRLVIVGARHNERLVGYVVWFLYHNPHYKHVLCAQEDIHYLLPEYRQGMVGYSMIKAAVDVLRKLGVNYVTMREKIGHEHPALMKRLGFEPLDLVYSRKLEPIGASDGS